MSSSSEESYQLSWNELFQRFVSEMFQVQEEKAGDDSIEHLAAQGLPVPEILNRLQNNLNFVRIKYARTFLPFKLPETNHLSVLSQGLSTYLRASLSDPQFDALGSLISYSISHWLRSLTNLPVGPHDQSFFSHNLPQSREQVLRAVLQHRFPNFVSDGYKALLLDPVIYSNLSKTVDVSKLCLPSNSVKQITDSKKLLDEILEDAEAKKAPIMLLLSTQNVSSLEELQNFFQIAKDNGLWVHVEGDDLALLASDHPPAILKFVKQADSFTVNPSDWYGLATNVFCTFLQTPIHPISPPDQQLSIALPLWISIQFMGSENLRHTISYAQQLSSQMFDFLRLNPSINFYSCSKSLSVNFRYVPDTNQPLLFHTDFLNSINKQVLIDMGDSTHTLGLDVWDYGDGFEVLRFRPLYHYEMAKITTHDIESFCENLAKITSCINATLSCGPLFQEAVQKCPGLQIVDVRNFVGIGAVRYLPSFLRGIELAPELHSQINEANANLAIKLSQVDPLYSLGQSTDGSACVCLGVETKPISPDTPRLFAEFIEETAKSLDIFTKLQDSVSDVILRGIKEAQQQLEQEIENTNKEIGIVRNIPVVGSLMNWWSPVKTDNISGKRFDIKTTKVQDVTASPRRTPSSSSSSSLLATPTTPTTSSRASPQDVPPLETLPEALLENLPKTRLTFEDEPQE